MEIFTDTDGSIILRKYSPINELGSFARQYVQAISSTTGHTVCITDKDEVVAAAGPLKKEVENLPLSKKLEEAINRRISMLANKKDKDYINVSNNETGNFTQQAISTIICQGDAMGAVIILGHENGNVVGEAELKIAKSASNLIGMQMES